jgi:OmpA-OmpF porin, OOP family
MKRISDTCWANLVIVESKPMQAGLVNVDAAAMAKGLDAEGHIALYEVFFETDKADLKPESGKALGEIAKLLTSLPQLKILVVGHTDNVGALDYNRSLSERRAQAVVEALSKATRGRTRAADRPRRRHGGAGRKQ